MAADVYMECMANEIEPFYTVLGPKIQKAREHKKMTQAQLGACLIPPTTRASIANIENGKQRVLAHTLVQLARAMEIDVQELIPGSEPSVQAASPNAVARELKRKLNLGVPELRKLGVATTSSNTGNRKKA
jgi:transcriptional regulator with XRE-family HTH domain